MSRLPPRSPLAPSVRGALTIRKAVEGRYVGSRRRETGGPRCVKHHGALLCLASAEDLAPPLANDVWTSAAHFQDPLAPSQCASESRHDFDLSAVQVSRLPGNDRPLTHTVTLRMARSFGLVLWRHSISSPRLIQQTPCPPRLLATLHLIRSLPLRGAARSLIGSAAPET